MIDLLGKRPFLNRGDDMDKWLDENMKQQRSAPAPFEDVQDGPAPAPLATSKAVNLQDFRH
jgi:AFG3 family protein